MSVKSRARVFIDSQEFLAYLIGLIFATLLIGYAPSSIALGIFIFFGLRHSVISKNKQKLHLKLLLPIGLYALFICTLMWTTDHAQTSKGLSRTISLFFVPVVFNLIPKFTLKSYNLILRIFTGANLLIGLFFLTSASIRYLKTNSLSVFTYHELVSDLELNAIYVSVTFVVSFFYILSKKNKTTLDIVIVVFFGVLITLLSSKLILSVLLLGSFFYLLRFKVNKVKLTLIILIGALIAGLAAIKPLERIMFEKETNITEVWVKKEFGPVYLWTGTSIRLLQLRILKEQLEEEAILWKGFGLFASKDNIRKRHLEFETYPGFHAYNYHNQYAQILSETGIIGLLILLAIIGALFTTAFNSKNFLIIMFSVTSAFVFLTESLLWRQTGLFLFILLYCLFNRTMLENINHKANNAI